MRGRMADGRRRSPAAIIVMIVLALLWTLPTFGMLVTSFRSRTDAASSGWWAALVGPFETGWTLDNYQRVLENTNLGGALVNSVVVAVPAAVLPIMFAAFAAYAVAFTRFPPEELWFVLLVALIVVPVQVARPPRLGLLGARGLGTSGDFVSVWLRHPGFGMPLALYVLRNYVSGLPTAVVESAQIDGASHY